MIWWLLTTSAWAGNVQSGPPPRIQAEVRSVAAPADMGQMAGLPQRATLALLSDGWRAVKLGAERFGIDRGPGTPVRHAVEGRCTLVEGAELWRCHGGEGRYVDVHTGEPLATPLPGEGVGRGRVGVRTSGEAVSWRDLDGGASGEIELPGAEGAWAHSERWMSVAGPTGRWLLRRVGDRFDVVAEVPSSIGAVEVSPDGRRIAFVDHRAETVTVRGPRRSWGTVEIGPASSLSLAWSGDGEVLAVHTVQAFEADGVTWLSTEGGQLVQTRRQHGRIEALAPTTDDVGAVVVGDGGRVRVVTSTDRPLVRLPALHTWSAGPMSTQLFASPDGSSWQLSGFGAPFVAEGASRRVEVPPHPVRANQFHDVHWTLDLGPDHAITTAPSGAVGRWTLDALSFDTYVSSEGGSPDYVDPSLDDAGRLLLLQDTLVDARSGHVVRRFDRPAGDVVGAALSPDGRHVALQVRVPQQADVDVLLFVAETGERRWTRRLEGGFRPRTIAITDDSVVVSARQLVSLARSTGEVQATRSLPTHRLAGRDDLVLVSSWSPFSAHVHALDPVTLSTKWRAEDAWQVALREDGAVYVGTGEDETRVRRLDPTSGKTLETWPVDAYRSLDARHGRVGVTTRRGQLHVWEDA